MKKLNKSDAIYPLISLTVLIFLWEGIVRLNQLPKYILPSPSNILITLLKDIDLIWMHTKITLFEAFVGFGLAIIFAYILAIVMDSFEIIKKLFYPLLVISQTIPVIAIAPILIIWFGFGTLPKILVVLMSCFFPIIINLVDGLNKIDPDYLQLFEGMNATKLQTFYHLKAPLAMVHLISGVKIAATYMIVSAIVAEWLGGEKGIGVYMVRAKNSYALDKVFASIVVIIIISLITIYLIDFIGDHLIRWKKYEGEN